MSEANLEQSSCAN